MAMRAAGTKRCVYKGIFYTCLKQTLLVIFLQRTHNSTYLQVPNIPHHYSTEKPDPTMNFTTLALLLITASLAVSSDCDTGSQYCGKSLIVTGNSPDLLKLYLFSDISQTKNTSLSSKVPSREPPNQLTTITSWIPSSSVSAPTRSSTARLALWIGVLDLREGISAIKLPWLLQVGDLMVMLCVVSFRHD